MAIINKKINELVDETASNIYDIERIIYTGRYQFIDKDFSLLSKYSLVMLYSLWEGFIQDLFRLYLEEINTKISLIYELNERFMLWQIEEKFKQFNEYPAKEKGKINFQLNLKDFVTQTNHELNTNINCQNNLGFEILNKILVTFNIDVIPEHLFPYKYPNRTVKKFLEDLLFHRNNQAHGNNQMANVTISQSQFIEYKDFIVNMLYEVSFRVLDNLDKQKYLKI